MLARREPLPLFITCQSKTCGAVVAVGSREEQRDRHFCDPCLAAISAVEQRAARINISLDARRRGAQKSAEVRRARAIARFQHMTALEIYQLGWRYGYNTGREDRLKGKAAR